MAIKDSIANLRKALRTTQTNAPAVIDTLIRGLDGVEGEVEKGEIYTADEQEIGTWIDGSKLYSAYVDFGSLPSNDMKSKKIAGIDIKELSGSAFSDDYVITLPYIYPAVGSTQVVGLYAAKNSTQPNKDTIRIITNSDRTGFTARVKIKYTKVEASRSPENDTKNDGNEEKNTDER